MESNDPGFRRAVNPVIPLITPGLFLFGAAGAGHLCGRIETNGDARCGLASAPSVGAIFPICPRAARLFFWPIKSGSLITWIKLLFTLC